MLQPGALNLVHNVRRPSPVGAGVDMEGDLQLALGEVVEGLHDRGIWPRDGWWAVCVTDGLGAHVLPTWGKNVLFDEEGQLERYGAWEVYRALRIFKPEGVAA